MSFPAPTSLDNSRGSLRGCRVRHQLYGGPEGEGAQAEHFVESVRLSVSRIVRFEEAPQQPCYQLDLNHGDLTRPEEEDRSLVEASIGLFGDDEGSLYITSVCCDK